MPRRDVAAGPGRSAAVTDATDLERRYGRLLACYPAALRREREQEILPVLLAGAAEGQRRPRLAESADLVRNAMLMRLRQMKRLPSYAYRHPRLIARVRVGIGIWLLVLGAILYGSGYWWGVLMVAPAALHFYLAYRLGHSVQS
jgi:hypothetical protein